MIFKTKKGKYQLSFLILVRAQGLAPPPRHSFAKAHRRPKVRLSLVVEPFLQCSLPYRAKKQKTPVWELFRFGTRAGIGFAAAFSLGFPPHRRTSVRLSALSNPFSSVLLPYCAKKQKTPIRESFFVLVRELDIHS